MSTGKQTAAAAAALIWLECIDWCQEGGWLSTGCHRTPRWLLLCLACNQPIHPNPFSVDQKPSAGRADVDLPAAGGQTGQQVGSAHRDLENRPGDGGLGWLLGCVVNPNSPRPGPGPGPRPLACWQDNLWSHPTPYSTDCYYGTIGLRTTALRSDLWRHPSPQAVTPLLAHRRCPRCWLPSC